MVIIIVIIMSIVAIIMILSFAVAYCACGLVHEDARDHVEDAEVVEDREEDHEEAGRDWRAEERTTIFCSRTARELISVARPGLGNTGIVSRSLVGVYGGDTAPHS